MAAIGHRGSCKLDWRKSATLDDCQGSAAKRQQGRGSLAVMAKHQRQIRGRRHSGTGCWCRVCSQQLVCGGLQSGRGLRAEVLLQLRLRVEELYAPGDVCLHRRGGVE